MPKADADEIKARIADGGISAITIDTAIFDKYGCNLRYPLLRKLDQFRGGNVSVVISEIVAAEVQAHISRDAAETQRALKSAISAHRKRWNLTAVEAMPPITFQIEKDAIAAADQQFTEYLGAIGGEIVPASQPATVPAEVLRRYFATEPPFEAGEKKKHEFPDAFALLSLEAWAAQRGALLLCVSADKGWRDFASHSNYLVWTNDLNLALSFFNDTGRTLAEQVVARLRAGEAADILLAIENAFEYRLDDNHYHIEAWSPLEFEAEPIGAVLQEIDWESASQPVVIAADEESATFTIKLKATVGFDALFSYYHHDSFDRDYTSIGSEEEHVEREIEFELALEVSREEQPVVYAAEIAKRHFEVSFGNIEPFRHEDPTHEKY